MDTRGLLTGFPSQDDLISGLMPGQLYVIASRPGMGKTSFALNICKNVTMTTEKTVAIFSLEQEHGRLVNNYLLPSIAHVTHESLNEGKLNAEDLRNIKAAKGNIEKHIFIDDTPSRTVPEMMAQCRSFEDLGLVIIDYLQLVHNGGQSRIEKKRIIGVITQSLKKWQ